MRFNRLMERVRIEAMNYTDYPEVAEIYKIVVRHAKKTYGYYFTDDFIQFIEKIWD
ncbi:MAG: hypothetical protein JXA77_05245 [Bacteroidales bacterium]|nr:hypothetical protein [Bacteroidales bacterium]MBN2820454.1 hypothetical protein [Bacteroidales bacterium]